MSHPKVSVIIPTHQRLPQLKALVKSFEEQSLPLDQFEVLIVPSPNDPSLEFLKNYQGSLNLRMKLPENDPWRGKNVSFKRNYGAQQAKATWLAFIDDDCLAGADWLKNALPYFDKEGVGGIEGKTITPEDSPKTLTWKGMQRLANFGGYQTCNIFYKKEVFLQTGGFDRDGFPWFLEDTDLAFSVLGTGAQIIGVEDCVVIHPVAVKGGAWRIIHEAKGAGLKVKLYKKHPQLYRQRGMSALRKSHYLYLLAMGLFMVSLLTLNKVFILGSVGFLTLILLAHMIKLFRGLKTTPLEIFAVAWRTLMFPPIAFLSIVGSLFKHKCSPKEFFQLLKPS